MNDLLRADLIMRLKGDQLLLDSLILRTPTGPERDELTDANINILNLISDLERGA